MPDAQGVCGGAQSEFAQTQVVLLGGPGFGACEPSFVVQHQDGDGGRLGFENGKPHAQMG
jgi:hypothetical protein